VSADYWLEIDTGGEEPATVSETLNVTYNLGTMLREAGFPAWRALIGAPASETGGMLRKVADTLKADRPRFEAMNPENGWGSYRWALEFVELFAEQCAAHPKATIGGWL
jgi:hypothetical protein